VLRLRGRPVQRAAGRAAAGGGRGGGGAAVRHRGDRGRVTTGPDHSHPGVPREQTMNFHVGTSGYSYKEWKGTFYPRDLPDKQMLRYYGERFRAVEINNTFYRMPEAAVLRAWAEAVPADFQFVLKAPQQITHRQRLKDAGDATT